MEISKNLIETELKLLVEGSNTLEYTVKEIIDYIKMRDEAINYTRCCETLKDKKITDLLNWVKSDLAQETNVKIGKKATPYITEKLKFLNKLLEIKSL
jgi:NADH:ubiquinone oxidoreductase subunit C